MFSGIITSEVVHIACVTEDLVIAAKNGTEADLLILWAEVRRLSCWLVNRWILTWGGHGGVTREDLDQAAFLAFLQAIRGYEPEAGPFIPFFAVCVKRELARAAGCKTPKQARDPLHGALSLDEPIKGAGPDGPTLLDIVDDPRDYISEAEDRIFQEQFGEAVRAALDELPEDQAGVVRGRFFEGRTRAELAKEAGVSPATIQLRERRALTRLRKRQDLRSFAQEMNFYNGTDLASFRRTGSSATERHALRLLGYSA